MTYYSTFISRFYVFFRIVYEKSSIIKWRQSQDEWKTNWSMQWLKKRKNIIKMTSRSKMNINNWFIMTRRMRILNIFSRLKTLSTTKSILFFEQENMKNEWIILRKNRSYELQKINSSYELYLNDICFVDNCLKMIAINELITLKWIKNEKIVFTAMRSTNALILYWINKQYN